MDEPLKPEFEPLECFVFAEGVAGLRGGMCNAITIKGHSGFQGPLLPATLLPRARYERLLEIEAAAKQGICGPAAVGARHGRDVKCVDSYRDRSKWCATCLAQEPTDGR